ncbi:MAG TPA: amidohydrolase family protein [Bryobacteraceae bacterium]|nr:amidohydrolase family protein [Bryobacteraceae bacterium]
MPARNRDLKGAAAALALLLLAVPAITQQQPPITQTFITISAPTIVLRNVRVIDGTGAPALEDQAIVIADGKIRSIGPNNSVQIPAGAQAVDLAGRTVLPGLVGMHDHMFYPSPYGEGGRVPGAPGSYNEMDVSFPRLYLGAGVTTVRTTGTLEPYTDLQMKQAIDSGRIPGPSMYVTGPYLEGAGNTSMLQMHWLTGPDDATRTVNYWLDEGVHDFKAYMHITRAELAAAVKAAHARGAKVTGHLCSIGFTEAANIGIDDLEHGLTVDTEFDPGKEPDVCPGGMSAPTGAVIAAIDLNSAPVQNMIHTLIAKHVAITSTLPVFEPNRPSTPRILDALSPQARVDFLAANSGRGRSGNTPAGNNPEAGRGGAGRGAQGLAVFKKEQAFEHMFAQAGGTLLAGLDPTGYGGVLAGFGDQREVELLVDAGFTPLEAIHIATENGANFLAAGDKIGTLKPGKQADLIVVRGKPDQQISDIENVETVFKNGAGYDSSKLIDSVKGQVGIH